MGLLDFDPQLFHEVVVSNKKIVITTYKDQKKLPDQIVDTKIIKKEIWQDAPRDWKPDCEKMIFVPNINEKKEISGKGICVKHKWITIGKKNASGRLYIKTPKSKKTFHQYVIHKLPNEDTPKIENYHGMWGSKTYYDDTFHDIMSKTLFDQKTELPREHWEFINRTRLNNLDLI